MGGLELYPEDERLTREEALYLMTHGSAYFSGDQDDKGRLSRGLLADLAVLDPGAPPKPTPDWSPVRTFGGYQG